MQAIFSLKWKANSSKVRYVRDVNRLSNCQTSRRVNRVEKKELPGSLKASLRLVTKDLKWEESAWRCVTLHPHSVAQLQAGHLQRLGFCHISIVKQERSKGIDMEPPRE